MYGPCEKGEGETATGSVESAGLAGWLGEVHAFYFP